MKNLLYIMTLILFFCFKNGLAQSENNHSTSFEFLQPKLAQEIKDEQDLQNAIIAYRFWYPSVSVEATFQSNRDIGIKENKEGMMFFTKPHHVGFTFNSDTPYGVLTLDLSKEPFVVEIPSGAYIALANDHYQQWIVDMGIPGVDQGKGGKYLILPPDYKGNIPAGYHLAHSQSNKIVIAIRVIPANGDITTALNNIRNIKVYPLSTSAQPQLITFIDASNTKMDTTPVRWETNLKYWEALHHIIETEPVVQQFLPMYGLLSSLGIEKSKPFSPDARMKNILEQAAKKGFQQMMISGFANTKPDRIVWPDRKWEWAVLTDAVDFKTPTSMDLDARDRWFIQAVAMSPAMLRRQAGEGSLYWLGARDKEGAFLNGSNYYKLVIPQPVPGKLFWSITVYDTATRSEIQTKQNKAALRSLFELKDLKDNSITLYFGPTPPTNNDKVWIQTIPGKNWFTYFRIYGPEAAAFNGSWQLGDFEKIQK